ncbi:hypothetical protein CVT24_004206 [Panaeolus cyanescens]|uniref:DJ-1/PfpI domain-containing protein n=1 Tax=Panaeolus cyanescens TaxID=181874 RepID=A0A409YSZ5_9AGAR|nr:hypothetical protein CVT24_004206 [Panaeolus cyanescens]
MSETVTWNIGVLLLPFHQLLDWVGPTDYISNHSQPMVSLLVANFGLPESIIKKAPIINFHYVSHSLEPVLASCGPPIHPTVTTADCPHLDYLIIPGPDPYAKLSDEIDGFIKKLWADPSFKAFLTVCSGSMVIAPTGVLDGHSVCSNKVTLRDAARKGKLYKGVNWIGDKRWHHDGRVWSAAGVTAGIDLAAAFLAAQLDKELLDVLEDVAEYSPNPDQPDKFAKILEGVNLN